MSCVRGTLPGSSSASPELVCRLMGWSGRCASYRLAGGCALCETSNRSRPLVPKGHPAMPCVCHAVTLRWLTIHHIHHTLMVQSPSRRQSAVTTLALTRDESTETPGGSCCNVHCQQIWRDCSMLRPDLRGEGAFTVSGAAGAGVWRTPRPEQPVDWCRARSSISYVYRYM